MDTMDHVPGEHGESSDDDMPKTAVNEKQCHTKDVQQFLKERSADIRQTKQSSQQSKQSSQQSKQSSQQSNKSGQQSLPPQQRSQEYSDLKVALMRRISDKEEGKSEDGLGSRESSWPVPNPYAQAVPEVLNPFKTSTPSKQADPGKSPEQVPGTAIPLQNGQGKATPSKGQQICHCLPCQLHKCMTVYTKCLHYLWELSFK